MCHIIPSCVGIKSLRLITSRLPIAMRNLGNFRYKGSIDHDGHRPLGH